MEKEQIKISEDYIHGVYENLCVEVIEKTIEYARELNFPKKNREGSLNRIMHGTEFIHGMLKRGLIDNSLYQQLKRLAEDPTMEYNIVIT